MNLHLDLRGENDFAFYIDGDLQFDSRDEAIYHESLALPALSLVASRIRHNKSTALDSGIRVLICGGGDGLALRECLRFPGVSAVDLVDYSPEVVEQGRTRFAALNQSAFDDPRTTVHIMDAWEYLKGFATPNGSAPPPYDVILCDFTVPQREEDTRIYSLEWYRLLREALAPDGIMAINGFSPQSTPEAFWCLRQTVAAARLSPQPYRVCIPSFREQGYGVWAFLLAGKRLRRTELRDLVCPVETRQVDLTALWRGAEFSAEERRRAKRIPVHTLTSPCLLSLLLNPGIEPLDTSAPVRNDPFDLSRLLSAIPIVHPYHTRIMIESLAEQVVGTVRQLDVQRLVDALLRRAQALPRELCQELRRLQDLLAGGMSRFELCLDFSGWMRKLFVTLVVLMTLANAIAPDNAFAKGASSFGHASMSRGFSGSSFGRSGSFGKGAGGFQSGTHTGSSFGKGAGGYRGQGSFAAHGEFGPAPAITRSGFRRSYGTRAVDIEGNEYGQHVYTYHSYSGAGYRSSALPNQKREPAQPHKAVFVADDDMLVLDNGDVVITLSERAYLLVSGATLTLMSKQSDVPLQPLYPEPEFFQSVHDQLMERRAQVEHGIQTRREWLAWVGWTSAMMGTVREDQTELHNLEELNQRLNTAIDRVQMPQVAEKVQLNLPTASPDTEPAGVVEICVNVFLMPNGQVAMCQPDGHWAYTNGKAINDGKHVTPCPPEMGSAIRSVLVKLQKELKGDINSLENDLNQLKLEANSLQSDLITYQGLENSYGGSYEVDYGTESISASTAVWRTQRDINDNQKSQQEQQKEYKKAVADEQAIATATEQFGK